MSMFQNKIRLPLAIAAILLLGVAALASTSLTGFFNLDVGESSTGAGTSASTFSNTNTVVAVGGDSTSPSGFTSYVGNSAPVDGVPSSVHDWAVLHD